MVDCLRSGVSFALIANWVAFGPGERQFSGGGSVGPVGVGGRVGELPGRIAFGFSAVLLWLIVLGGIVQTLRRRAD